MLFVRPGPCIYVLFLEGEFSDSFSFMAACRHHIPLTSPFLLPAERLLLCCLTAYLAILMQARRERLDPPRYRRLRSLGFRVVQWAST